MATTDRKPNREEVLHELKTMRTIACALATHDAEARQRLLQWAAQWSKLMELEESQASNGLDTLFVETTRR